MKWFKLYTELAQHPRLRILAFEDRWHYVSLMCAKADGTLDQDATLRDKMLGVHLGLSAVEMDAVKDRLLDVDLITSDWDIINWDDKQSSDATGAARKRRQRAKEKLSKEKELRIKNKEQNVTVTGQSRDSHGTEKDDQIAKNWSLFPKKIAKSKAVSKMSNMDMATLQLIEKDLRSREWSSDPRYILHPSTYLNNERWLDEVSAPEQKDDELYV